MSFEQTNGKSDSSRSSPPESEVLVSPWCPSSLHLRINQVHCQVKGNMTNTSLLNHQLSLLQPFLSSLSHTVGIYLLQTDIEKERRKSLTVDLSSSCCHIEEEIDYIENVLLVYFFNPCNKTRDNGKSASLCISFFAVSLVSQIRLHHFVPHFSHLPLPVSLTCPLRVLFLSRQ
jgi:hypothetical protein